MLTRIQVHEKAMELVTQTNLELVVHLIHKRLLIKAWQLQASAICALHRYMFCLYHFNNGVTEVVLTRMDELRVEEGESLHLVDFHLPDSASGLADEGKLLWRSR